jgi:hypothetical protein
MTSIRTLSHRSWASFQYSFLKAGRIPAPYPTGETWTYGSSSGLPVNEALLAWPTSPRPDRKVILMAWRSLLEVWRGRALGLFGPVSTSRDRDIQRGAQRLKSALREVEDVTAPASTPVRGSIEQIHAQEQPIPSPSEGSNPSASTEEGDSRANYSLLHRILSRVIAWLLFNVGIALLPLIFTAIHDLGTNHNISLDRLLAEGDLVLISVAIAAGAAGEIAYHQGYKGAIKNIILDWTTLAICVMGGWWYAEITSTTWPSGAVTRGSLFLFCSALITGLCSIVRSEVR